MNFLFLLDVRPDPVPVAGVGGLIVLSFVVLMFTAALIVGFVFLLKVLKQGGLRSKLNRLRFMRLILGDVCFSFDAISPQSKGVSHNNGSRE